MNTFIEKQIDAVLKKALGQQALTILKSINKIAERQGGRNILQNYQLLGKRAAIGAGVAITAVSLGGGAIGVTVKRRLRQRHIEKTSVETCEIERMREHEVELATKPSFYKRYGKRACDIAVSVVALPIVGAVSAASGIAIKNEDGGPIFYNAPRVGKDGREFTMFKLRSMKENAPDLVMDDGSTYNSADDPRMTNVGKFLRKASLDEIPQFLNVLRGDMSVVGPRPDLKRETELYQGDEALKLTVKPGVTGYAAVYGRNSLPWHDRLALDVEYVRNLSFPLDVKIFLMTFGAVFKQDGIFVEDAQTPKLEQ